MLFPVEWYWPTPATGPVPCRWAGWVYLSTSTGWQYVEVSLYAN